MNVCQREIFIIAFLLELAHIQSHALNWNNNKSCRFAFGSFLFIAILPLKTEIEFSAKQFSEAATREDGEIDFSSLPLVVLCTDELCKWRMRAKRVKSRIALILWLFYNQIDLVRIITSLTSLQRKPHNLDPRRWPGCLQRRKLVLLSLLRNANFWTLDWVRDWEAYQLLAKRASAGFQHFPPLANND